MLYFIFELLLIAISVFAHELGHFLACKILNFQVFEFSLGVGPKLFTLKNFTLRLNPIASYVVYGYETEDTSTEYSIKKSIVYVSGILMNMLMVVLGILLNSHVFVFINTFLIIFNTIPINKTESGFSSDGKKFFNEIKKIV
ncbi:hypothetical protein B5E87_00140 [Massilimicrobiota sp. An142]|uniref:site-2 protease family protein n=1 Tax=Massilimicrobiota sp. An142 TaxID=1965564 RepID=UPI000B385221|nr:site-2 protease family protein [Massilimicrobiota sp. An142]OUQ15015.1 hypothetical protein B5E87_00140 [Massilimicrobiota sp. An142]